MQQDFAQRRRVAFALAITVILVPAALLLNRGGTDEGDGPLGTLVGTVQIPGQTADGDGAEGRRDPAATDPMGTTPRAYIDGTLPEQTDDPATIAIPRVGRSIRGSATFSRNISDPSSCQVRDLVSIPFNSTVTVTNLDNSRSVRCIASVGGPAPDDDIVLNPDAFLRIGDLTDAPLTIELTW